MGKIFASGQGDELWVRLNEKLFRAADELALEFDSVLIMVTKHGVDGDTITSSMEVGRGNVHAQYGQARHWIEKQDQYARCKAIRDDQEEDEDDDDQQ